MVCGAIPYSSFKERVQIINELKKEFGKVKIMVMDDVVVYKTNEKYRVVKL
jgi:phosphopantetheine adenylyltransferase